MADQTLMDKSLRSVFVGNIPYEATEEKLKDIFNEVGPVISFKLVYDRETGKPKGYGFCEYKDQETALSAMRNLNSYEIGGRTLRVDNACTEKSRMEMQNLMQGPAVENPYGEAVQGDKAPETISKAVASLPPEQMFELMKQMKDCVQNNPSQARAMLLQNPQLAYALLQAQVVMRIVDPATAASMLHKANPVPSSLTAQEKPLPVPVPAPMPVPPPAQVPTVSASDSPGQTAIEQAPRVDPRLARNPDRGSDRTVDRNPDRNPDPVDHFPRDPRMGGMGAGRVDPRTVASRPPSINPAARALPVTAPSSGMSPNTGSAASDQEKAALIMQVLQLSDEQIAMLPPEQRQSILVLKEQIAKSTQR